MLGTNELLPKGRQHVHLFNIYFSSEVSNRCPYCPQDFISNTVAVGTLNNAHLMYAQGTPKR